LAVRAGAVVPRLADGSVFDRTVRFAQSAAVACRAQGITAAEYEARARSAAPWYEARAAGTPVERYSSAAGPLAEDYQDLIEQILGAIVASMAENAAASETVA
jgi:hypothetical protein